MGSSSKRSTTYNSTAASTSYMQKKMSRLDSQVSVDDRSMAASSSQEGSSFIKNSPDNASGMNTSGFSNNKF